MNKETRKILAKICSTAGWLDDISDFIKGKPAINKSDVEKLEKFKKQSKALLEMLKNATNKMNQVGIEGNWGKDKLDVAIKYLSDFVEALHAPYEVKYEKPAEEVK